MELWVAIYHWLSMKEEPQNLDQIHTAFFKHPVSKIDDTLKENKEHFKRWKNKKYSVIR